MPTYRRGLLKRPAPTLKKGFLSDSLQESPQKIGMSASEWKPVRELGKAERTDRPEAGLNLFEQPVKKSYSANR